GREPLPRVNATPQRSWSLDQPRLDGRLTAWRNGGARISTVAWPSSKWEPSTNLAFGRLTRRSPNGRGGRRNRPHVNGRGEARRQPSRDAATTSVSSSTSA